MKIFKEYYMFKKIIFLFLLALSLFLFASCSNGFTVTFMYEDGTIIEVIEVKEGEEIKTPEVECEEGYEFVKWDQDLTNITSDIIVKPVFEKIDYSKRKITVMASSTPHAEILNCEAVITYIESKGYKLNVEILLDFTTPNKYLNIGLVDANYFQHLSYMEYDILMNNYNILGAAKIHFETLNLYGKETPESWDGKTIYISSEYSSIEGTLKLLKENNLISSYNIDTFKTSNPMESVESDIITIKCIDPDLLCEKVSDGEYAAIPSYYALHGLGAKLCKEYTIIRESNESGDDIANIICVREDNKNSEKIKVLLEALAQEEVKEFIEEKYGTTIVYCYKNLLNE